MATATLKGKLTLNDQLFHTGLKRAEGAVKHFVTGPVTQLGGAVAGLFTIDAFKNGIEGAFKLGDELFKLNKQTGINVASLAELQQAGLEAGTDIESVAHAVGKMQRSLVAGVGKGSGDTAFRFLKLDAQELIELKPEQALQKIGGAISAIPDAAVRSAMAMKIFGRSGAELLPLFEVMGKSDFGSLSKRAELLRDNATKFHGVTVEMRQVEENFKTGFIGFAAALGPAIVKLSELFKGIDFSTIGKSWGEQLVTGIVDFFNDRMADVIVAAMKDKIGNAFGEIGLPGVAKMYHADAETIRHGVQKARQESGLMPSGPVAETAPVTVAGYLSPLEGKTGLSAASLGHTFSPEAWRKLFSPRMRLKGTNFEPIGGSLSRGAFGQAGGLGSAGLWDNKAIMALGDDALQKMLFTESERQGIQNQLVAAGGQREAMTPGGYNAVASGDLERRQGFLKQQLRQKLGIDRSNELLESIKTATETTAEAMGD